MSSELDELQSAFEEMVNDQSSAPTSGGGNGKYIPVPDGKGIVAVVKKGGCEHSPGRSPRTFYNLYFPKHNVDETARFTWDARNKMGLKINYRQLKNLGVEPRTASPSELDRVSRSIEGWTISVEKRTRPNPNGKYPYRDYYFEKVLEKAPQSVKSTTADESDIPF